MYLTPFVQGPYEVPRTRRCEKGPPPITRQTSTSFVWSVVESLAVAKRSMIMRGTWLEVNQPSSSCSSFLAISSIFSGGQPGLSLPRLRPRADRTSLFSSFGREPFREGGSKYVLLWCVDFKIKKKP